MYARVARVGVDPSRLDGFVRDWEAGVLSVAKQQAGYVRALGLYDAEANEAMSVILFETREQLEGAARALQGAGATAREFASGPASFGTYEVLVDE